MDTNGIPRIDRILPGAAIPGGDVTIYGSGFVPRPNTRPRVRFGETEASLLISAQNYVIARVPDGAVGGIVLGFAATTRPKEQEGRVKMDEALPGRFIATFTQPSQ